MRGKHGVWEDDGGTGRGERGDERKGEFLFMVVIVFVCGSVFGIVLQRTVALAITALSGADNLACIATPCT